MDWKEILIGTIGIVLIIIFFSSFIFCDNISDDGGNCKYCGRETNWTYKNGGYICPACD